MLTPCFVHEDCRCIRQIETALAGTHRQAQAAIGGQGIEHRLRQTAGLRSEDERVANLVTDLVIALTSAGGYTKPTVWPNVCQERVEIGMLPNIGKLAVVEAGAPKTLVIKFKTKRVDKVQCAAGISAQAYDVTGVRGYLRLVKNDVKQGKELGFND